MENDSKVLIFRESAKESDGRIIENRRTFAVIVLPSDGIHNPVCVTRVAVGVSRCSDRDQFCKKRGREIAVGRARKIAAPDIDDTPDWIGGPKGTIMKVYCSSESEEFYREVMQRLKDVFCFRYTPPAPKPAPVPKSPLPLPPAIPAQSYTQAAELTDSDIPF